MYSRSGSSIVSSTLLEIKSPSPYSVIKNSHGVEIGQIIGDGFSIEISGNITGQMTVCMVQTISVASSSYSVPDFASM